MLLPALLPHCSLHLFPCLVWHHLFSCFQHLEQFLSLHSHPSIKPTSSRNPSSGLYTNDFSNLLCLNCCPLFCWCHTVGCSGQGHNLFSILYSPVLMSLRKYLIIVYVHPGSYSRLYTLLQCQSASMAQYKCLILVHGSLLSRDFQSGWILGCFSLCGYHRIHTYDFDVSSQEVKAWYINP